MSTETCCHEIEANICKGKSAVFCGAGISYNSGLPIVSDILQYLFRKLELSESQQNSIRQSGLPFESIMEIILNESGLDEIIDIFKAGTCNANHVFIAKLASKGYLKTVYTTNFDVLLEKALENEGLVQGVGFKVYSSEADLNDIIWDDHMIKVVKLHGSVTKKDDMAITLSMIASDRYTEIRRKTLQSIFGGAICNNVIVLGYSCSDLDLTPLIESLASPNPSIQFVEHTLPSSDGKGQLKVEDIHLKKEKNPFRNYVGKRYFINTDELVKCIWSSLLEDDYVNTSIPITGWQNNIDIWYSNSVKESGYGLKHHIASRILYAIGEFREAIAHHEKAIEIARRDDNKIAYASELGNMGMAFNALDEYEQAISCLEKSIPLCHHIGLKQGMTAQLQALGNVLHRTGNDKAAIGAFNEALKYAEHEADEYAISNILGNVSNSYNRLGAYGTAKILLEKALSISRKLGNKQAESSQLGIISYTHFAMGNSRQAIESCLMGIEIKKNIADRRGECQLLNNLISIYISCGMVNEAKKIVQDCLHLARATGNKEIERMVTMNMLKIG